jgi:hypothetical protein
VTVLSVLDTAGQRALPGDHVRLSRRPSAAQQEMLYPADPPTIDAIVAVMRQTATDGGCAR